MASPSLVRRIYLGVTALVALVAVAVIVSSVRRESARRSSLDLAAQPFVAHGFTVIETSQRGDPTKLETNVDAGCVLATSAKPAKLKLTHPAGIIDGDGPLLTCLCAPGAVALTSDKSAAGMVLLHIDAAALGGSHGYAFLPFKVGTTATTDAACADASLDAWVEAKKWAPSANDDALLDAKPILRTAGFAGAGTVKPEVPFTVVEIPANSCVLTVDANADDKVGLRLKGGAFAIGPATGNIGYCTTTPTTALVERQGTGAVSVFVAPAVKTGGLIGMREVAASAQIGVAALGLPSTDHDWMAKQLLLASDIPESLIVVGHENTDKEKDTRIASLSVEKPNTLEMSSPEGVFSFCDPPLDGAPRSLCVFSGPQRWRVEGPDSITGLARAKVPFWLFGFQSVAEPAALKLETQLVGLARRLKRAGFEPTTFEAVTETDTGAEVLGRANEDAIVAIGLAPIEPWAMPLSAASDKPWTIDGEPEILPIKPLQRISVMPTGTTKLPPKAKRRTLVFRHHA